MKIDGLQLSEGSSITNLVMPTGTQFPSLPNTGELFYRTDGEYKGLYVYEGSNSTWNKTFSSGDSVALPGNTTPGTYKSVVVSIQGLVTSGTNPTTLAGFGITDAQPIDADLSAIAALTGSSGFLKKTAADTWALDTNTYIVGNQTITLSGGLSGSGTTNINATVITNANLTGVVTSVGNATSIANGAISNSMLANGSITLGSTNIVLGSTTTTLAGLISVSSTGFTGALNGTVGAITPNSGAFTSVSASGKISSTVDSTTPTDGSAYFYKSSTGAIVSGYQAIIETGSAGNRTTKATFDNIGNFGLGITPSAWSFGGNIQMTPASCLTFNGPSYIGTNFYNNGGWRYTATAPSTIYSQTNGRHIWSNAVSGTIDTSISFVQGMELSANNNLIVTGSVTGTSFNSITGLSSTLPAAPGTAAIGVSTTAARSDHVHALQTSVSGSAATLATGRTFSVSTDATGTSASFDGSANVTIPMTLATVNSNVGSFGSATQVPLITLDAKGRTTAASNVSIAIPTSAVTSGTFADARIATSNITQHQASLTIAETQITDGTLLARNAGNETISGNWTFSNVVTGVTPSAASHLTTKAYVDGLATGLDTKASCRAATTANITLSGTQTIDGVAVIAGNRVLVKDQSTATQNGIYDVAAGAWVRSADADNLPGTEVTAGMYTFISEGTVNADTGWTLSTNDTVVLGTTPLTFTQFTGLGQISAGAGLTKTGSVIDIGTASASRIVINSDNIDLATAGTAGTYKSVTTDAYGRVTSGSNPTTLAGYGITDAVTAVSVVTANGVSGSVTSTTTPAITLTLGAITPSSVVASGQITAGNASGFHLDQIGIRSWYITATDGNLNIRSGDGSGYITTNTNLAVTGLLTAGATGGRLFSTDGSVIKTKIASNDGGWASYTMYEAASSTLSLGAFGAFGSTKDTAQYSYIATQGQDYSSATLKVTTNSATIAGDISTTGTITSTYIGGSPAFNASAATTGIKYLQIGNTGGTLILGVDSSAGAGLGTPATAYDAIIRTSTAVTVGNATSQFCRASSTGLAVTGAISASGEIMSSTSVGNAVVRAYGQNIGLLQIQSATGNTFAQMSGISGTLRLNVSTSSMPSGGGSQFVLDTSGNLGLGVTPSAWSTVVPAFQLGGAGAFVAAQGNAEVLRIGSNAYYNGGWKYSLAASNYASRYDQTAGTHTWYTAPSGTAGAAITFTERMNLSSTGLAVTGTLTTTGRFTSGLTNRSVLYISRGIQYSNGIKIKTSIPWAADDFWSMHIHGYHYRQGTNVDLRVCAYEYGTSGNPIAYSASSAGGWAPTVTLVNEAGLVSLVLGLNKDDGYYLQCSVDVTSQSLSAAELSGWTVVDETGTGIDVPYRSDFGYASVNSLGLNVTGRVVLTTTDALGGLGITGAAQSSVFNNATGTYSTWQYNGTSIGDIGTGNHVFSGGTSTDFGITARAGGRLVLGSNGSSKVILDTAGNLGLGVTPSAFFVDAGPALQINKFSIQQTGGFDVTALTTNGYQSSSGVMKYIGTAGATRYRHVNGSHYWDTAPSGTAGNTIAFTQAMILDLNSNLAVTGSINTAKGLNITGNGGFFNGANKFGIDHIAGASRFYSSGPNTTTQGVFEWHPISSDGSVDVIAMKLFENGRLHLKASVTNQVIQSFAGVGGTSAYVDFAAVEIGGQTSNGAWLRWTRGGSNDRDFSIHTTDSAATSYKTLNASHVGIQINGTITTTGGVDKLTTASGAVSVAAATAPTTGQVLTATSATTATWQASSTVAAAGTLTGTTLAANVVNSSLTSLGTLTSPLSVNAVTQDTTTTAVTTTSATVVDSISSSAFRTAKYIVQVTDSTNSQYHAVEIMVIHDGTTVYKTEYGEITTAASLGTFDAAIVTGTLRLSFTAVAATTKSVKVYRAAITA